MKRGNITKRGKESWQLKFDGPRGGDGKRQIRYATVKGTYKTRRKNSPASSTGTPASSRPPRATR